MFNILKDNLYFCINILNKNVEVDFFIPKERRAIQVSYSIADEMTKQREIKALLKLSEVYEVENFEIVTWDKDYVHEENKIAINILPVWKWLLKEDS